MPGIAGIIGSISAEASQRAITAMVETMRQESFYEWGTFDAPDVGVHVGWTAHPRSFAWRQCVAKKPPHLLWALSGECVDDRGGPNIAQEYARLGDDFVRHLNGLFSGLLIDREQRRVLLFNDRYGLERVYVHETPNALYFASEAKALLRVVPDARAFDDVGVAQFLGFGCTLGERTLFRGIRLLEGGSLWSFQQRDHRKQRYMTAASLESQSVLSAEAFNEEFSSTFSTVLGRYVGNGDGLGISLTGGLDTRMIMACLPNTSGRPIAYTFSGQRDRTLDERIASRVSAICGIEHRVLRIGADFLGDYGRYVDKTVRVTDGSSGATGAHEVYLNAQARQLAPIRLTGNFGSEILRSMSTFKPLGLTPAMFPSDFLTMVTSSAQTLEGAGDHPVTLSAFREIPWSLFGSLAAGRSQVTFRTPYLDNDIVSLAYRAPANSRCTADSALHLIAKNHPRLSRIPTDRGVVAGGYGPVHAARRLFADATFKLDYLHKEGLPSWLSPVEPAINGLSHFGILGLHKYLPYRRWFRNELRGYVAQVLTDAQTSRLPYWRAPFLTSLVADHVNGSRNYIREINAVLTLEAVNRLLLRDTARCDESPRHAAVTI